MMWTFCRLVPVVKVMPVDRPTRTRRVSVRIKRSQVAKCSVDVPIGLRWPHFISDRPSKHFSIYFVEKKMEWSKEKVISLINLYHDRPILWNCKINKYKNGKTRIDSFVKIAVSFVVAKEEVERKMFNLSFFTAS